jgi:hypothetical protein
MPPSAPSPDSADSADAASPAVVDGVRLAELTASLPVSRGSVFELVKALGIVTVKGPGPEGKGRVAWVSAADAERLAGAAATKGMDGERHGSFHAHFTHDRRISSETLAAQKIQRETACLLSSRSLVRIQQGAS